jgi:type II secretory pathway component GspD/PulD (secretin)
MEVNRTINRKRSRMTTGVGVVMILGLMLLPLQANAEDVTGDPLPETAVVTENHMGLTGQSIQTFEFSEGTTLKKALNMLQQMYQKNIVPTEKVNLNAIVTASHLYDVTFEEALQAVLGSNKYETKGNFIKVYTNEEFMADKSRFEHAMITLFYINSDEATKLVEPLLSEFGRLGATTAALPEMEAGTGGDRLAIHDRLVVSDYPENLQRIRDVLAEVDTEPIQVLLEVTVMQATLTDETKFGIDWKNITGASVTLGDSGFLQDGFSPSVATSGLSIGVTFDNISALITAVETVSDVTIMANPKILALNKQAGKLTIGREDGYLDTTSQNQSGSTTQSVAFLETGTILTFRPFIGRDGMIRMEINPEQSDGSVPTTTGLPEKSTTQIITNVMVKDGQTIVLGGLFQEQTTLSRSQVPLLGDIPVLGELFRGVGDKSERVELIILITPHIINTPTEANGDARMEDVLRITNEARKNLYWMSRAKIDEDRYSKAVKLYTEGNAEAALTALDCPYEIDRTYLDKIRLKERIIRETQPEEADQIERLMLQAIEKEESGKWMRR